MVKSRGMPALKLIMRSHPAALEIAALTPIGAEGGTASQELGSPGTTGVDEPQQRHLR